MKSDPARPRFGLLDALRGFAILNMIAYHLCYDIFIAYGVRPMWIGSVPAVIWERCICVTFITVSGISLNLSSRPWRRGIVVNLCGLLVTAVTLLFMPEQQIWFGVLSLLGCSMLIGAALRPLTARIHPLCGSALTLSLFALSYGVPHGYLGVFGYQLIELPGALYTTDVLAPLGLHSAAFISADYFPLIPWLFLFLFGYFLWRALERYRLTRLFTPRIAILDFIGRHSLIIYLAHQPVLIGICYLLFGYI